MLISTALLISASAIAAPRLTLFHGDAPLLEASPAPDRIESIVHDSTFVERHNDGFDMMQVRDVHAEELGDLAIGQVWRAWTGPVEFSDCTVSRFFLEVAEPWDMSESPEGTEFPGVEPGAALFFAELSCEDDALTPELLVSVDDPVPFDLVLRSDESEDAAAAMDSVLGEGMRHGPEVQTWRAQVGELEIQRHRKIDRTDTRLGHLLVERGRLHTGYGETACGGEDFVFNYVAIVLLDPQPILLHYAPLGEGGWISDFVDVDRDGLPELIGSNDFSDTWTLSRLSGETLDQNTPVWWGYCPC